MISGSCIKREESKEEDQGTKGTEDCIVPWNLHRLNLACFFILDKFANPRP
jgi:hypothetical protein